MRLRGAATYASESAAITSMTEKTIRRFVILFSVQSFWPLSTCTSWKKNCCKARSALATAALAGLFYGSEMCMAIGSDSFSELPGILGTS